MDLVMSAPSRGDTVVGHDVWLGYSALVLPGVTIGHGSCGRALPKRTWSDCSAPPGGTGPSS